MKIAFARCGMRPVPVVSSFQCHALALSGKIPICDNDETRSGARA